MPQSVLNTAATSALDPLDAYRRLFANAHDGLSAWWYFGTSFVDIESFPTIPVLQVETLMIYKTRTLSSDSFRMDWWEIGCMRDPTTGQLAISWTNPITGAVVATPDRFEEGPAHFIISRSGDGLAAELVQAHARVERVDVVLREVGERVWLEQTERKVRGFPLPDGSMPDLNSDSVSPARTRLSVFGARADLARDDAPASGAYEFELAPPPWMGFGALTGRSITRGIMVKAAMNQRLHPAAWKSLEGLFPDRFENHDVRPRWSD
jgi:hypothetical protein